MLKHRIHCIAREIAVSLRHDVLLVFFGFDGVAGPAVVRTDNDVDLISFVLKGVCMAARSDGVALGAADARSKEVLWNVFAGYAPFDFRLFKRFADRCHRVPTGLPVGDDAGMRFPVARDAFLGCRAHGRFVGQQRRDGGGADDSQ